MKIRIKSLLDFTQLSKSSCPYYNDPDAWVNGSTPSEPSSNPIPIQSSCAEGAFCCVEGLCEETTKLNGNCYACLKLERKVESEKKITELGKYTCKNASEV